jgi:hypothetical protein
MLFLTIKEAANLLNSNGIECHWHQVKRGVIEGKIKAIQDYRVYKIEGKKVYKFLDSLEAAKFVGILF